MERILKLLNAVGTEVDTIRFAANRELPDVIIWGLNQKQKTFLRGKGETYREVSFFCYSGEQTARKAFGIPSNR